MTTFARDDRYVQSPQGFSLSGAEVYWCTQPASTANNPPSPLATVYADLGGTEPITQPVITDGFGHAFAYMDDSILYTVVAWHPIFGVNPVVLQDQAIPGAGGGGGGGLQPFSGIPDGTIDGTNTVFTVVNGRTPLTVLPALSTAFLNTALVLGAGYSLAVVAGQLQITYSTAPQPASGSIPADVIYVQGWFA